MNDIVRKGGTGPDRTQFGEHDRTTAGVDLKPDTVHVSFTVTEDLQRNRVPLPALPQGLTQPRISFDYGDEDGRLYVYSQWKTDAPHEVGVTVWKGDDGEFENSIFAGAEATGLDEDTDDEIIEYLQAVYGRVDTRLYILNAQVLAQAEDAILTSIFG